MESEEMIESIKKRVGEVIIDLNLIESRILDILAIYIDSPKEHFIRQVLLNSLTIGLHQKVNVLKYIMKKEGLVEPKELFKAITLIGSMRNAVGHSANHLNLDYDFIGPDFDDEGNASIDYELKEPGISIINDGVINYPNISTIVSNFSKYYEIANMGLDALKVQIEAIPKINQT